MVTVYSKPVGCYACVFTKRKLDELGVEYVDIDITADAEAYEYVTKTLGHLQAPVVVAPDGSHWSGLQPDRIQALAA